MCVKTNTSCSKVFSPSACKVARLDTRPTKTNPRGKFVLKVHFNDFNGCMIAAYIKYCKVFHADQNDLYQEKIPSPAKTTLSVKAGVRLNAVFSSLNIDLMLITRSRFKQSKIPTLITGSYAVGYFVNFLAIFGYIWEEIIFLKGLVKFRKIGNRKI